MESEGPFLCHQCGRVFSRLSTLESHCKWKHAGKTTEFMCEQCGRTFQKKFNLLKHMSSGVHNVSETVRCATVGCDFKTLTRKLMCDHYENFHGIELKVTNIYFQEVEEFFLWKNEFENNTRSRFVKMSSSRKKKDGFLRSTYFCHRDGNFIPKGKNLRHPRIKGSNKINAHCPAKMEVEFGERIVLISYIDTHLGHELDVTRMNLSHADRVYIAQKLATQVPFEDILEEINSTTSENELKRVDLLTRKDLWNIVETFKIDPKSVVYSRSRTKRRKRMCQSRSEIERSLVNLSKINRGTEHYEVDGEGSATNFETVWMEDESAETLVCYPIIEQNENDYIEEYTLVTDEDQMSDETCLVINSEGVLETTTGQRVICTDDGELQICETQEEVVATETEQSQVFITESENTDDNFGEMNVVLNEDHKTECDNTLVSDDIVYITDSGSELNDTKNDFLVNYDIVETIKEEQEYEEVDTILEDNIETQTSSNEILKEENSSVAELVEVSTDLNKAVVTKIDNNLEYIVSDHFDEDQNEYTVISTPEEALIETCNSIDFQRENDVELMTTSPCNFHEQSDTEEVCEVESVEEQEEAIWFIVPDKDEQVVEVSEENETVWVKKRKEVFHKLLNVHKMINNEKQLQVLSNNISSLENVLKALSKKDEQESNA